MKVNMGFILIALFFNVGTGVYSSFGGVIAGADSHSSEVSEYIIGEDEVVEVFRERAEEAYWEGYNKLSCRDVRVSLIVSAIKVFMENPYSSPRAVLYIEATATVLEDTCEIGRCDRINGENNLSELLESLDSEMRVHLEDF